MIFLKNKKKAITLKKIELLAKSTNNNMKIEGQGIDDSRALEIAKEYFLSNGYKIV